MNIKVLEQKASQNVLKIISIILNTTKNVHNMNEIMEQFF